MQFRIKTTFSHSIDSHLAVSKYSSLLFLCLYKFPPFSALKNIFFFHNRAITQEADIRIARMHTKAQNHVGGQFEASRAAGEASSADVVVMVMHCCDSTFAGRCSESYTHTR